jgi:general secretion pathway protein A
MYTQFFGLGQVPFSIAPDPRYVFMSERHREALAHLLYGLDGGGGFVLLTGEIGTGKTTVCRLFLEQIPADCNVAYIFNPKQTVLELLRSICDEFGVSVPEIAPGTATVKDFIDPLNRYLLASHAAHQNNILIIDEAQNLSADVLEQLRLLTNLETNERKLLQIILIGQPELRAMLGKPELEQLAQRVIARYHLGALTSEETGKYIAHRMAVAGVKSGLPFSRRLMRRVHDRARGIPRRINLICDRALLGAYAGGKREVDARTIDIAAREVFGLEPVRRSARPSGWRYATAGIVAGAFFLGGTAMALEEYGWPPELAWKAVAAGPDPVEPGKADPGLIVAAASATPSPIAPAASPAVNSKEPGPAASMTEPEPAPSAAASSTASSAASSTAELAAEPGPANRPQPPSNGEPAGIAEPELASAPVPEPEPAPTIAEPPPSAADTTPIVLGNEVRDLPEAYRQLASFWQLDLARGNPCQAARKENVYCFDTKGLNEIRQLNRPGIVTLRDDQNQPYYALLVGLNSEHAMLRIGDVTSTVTLAALARRWRGEFSTFWRAPAGYRRQVQKGDRGPAVDWLATQIATVEGTEKPAGNLVYNNALSTRVREFQLAQGLWPDGIAGPQTFIRLASLTGLSEPRLETGPASIATKPPSRK